MTRHRLRPLGLLLAACAGPSAGPDHPHDDGRPPADPRDTGVDTALPGRVLLEILDQPLVVEVAREVRVVGRVRAIGLPPGAVTVTVTSDRDGARAPAVLGDDGGFTWTDDGLAPGRHRLAFEGVVEARVRAREVADVAVCRFPPVQTFDHDPIGQGWTSFGDAHWDPGGWMEITGNAQSRAGSIYMTSRKVDPGDFRLEFRIATGGGINSGADGYAVNVVDLPDVEALAAYVAAAQNGGCLGYGVAGGCDGGGVEVRSFHVELDTWHNTATPVTDPTSENHVAITRNGDPTDHLLWAPYPLEDLQWRQVAVEAQGEVLRLEIDGRTVIQQQVPGFRFDGGYIGVSGSTGWATNHHRFDDLRILDRCEVPD